MSDIEASIGFARIIGSNIRLARETQDLYQRELAGRVNVTPQRISDWENGRARPTDSNLLRIAQALGHDYAWFFTDRRVAA